MGLFWIWPKWGLICFPGVFLAKQKEKEEISGTFEKKTRQLKASLGNVKRERRGLQDKRKSLCWPCVGSRPRASIEMFLSRLIHELLLT